MKVWSGTFFLALCVIVGCGAYGASLLQGTSFPKTANDLTFTQRIELDTAGYEPWETEYDANGRCISGCLYPGITMQQELEILDRNTDAARVLLQDYLRYHATLPTTPSEQTTSPTSDSPANTQTVPTVPVAPPRCTPNNPDIPVDQTLPVGEPLTGHPRITSQYGPRIHPVTGNRSTHKAIDFAAPIGTPVFSTANGTVAAVWTDKTCGNGLRISHAQGMETVYCHLKRSLVKKGDTVNAGCLVAESGNTGRTTGPHLHYGIKKDGNYINPTEWIRR